jgi:hypothetical protein
MAEHKAKSLQAVCEECHLSVGTLTASAHGRPHVVVHANDSNCKHPPYTACPAFLTAFRKARALLK